MTQDKNNLYLKAKIAYYSGSPIMSDVQFDALEDEIRKENPENPVLKTIGAPLAKGTQKPKATHRIHMGSQEKVNTAEELTRWERLRANDKDALFHGSFKADGGSVALYYENGIFTQAISRGDGKEGEDITHQAPFFQGVPLTLTRPLNIGVRCEAVVTLTDWAKADPAQETNPRNVATGILGRLDTIKSHFVTLLAFDLDSLPNTKEAEEIRLIKDETTKSLLLQNLGFTTTPWKGHLTLSEIEQFFKETETKREANSLPFWIDGVVVKYEDLATQRNLGSSDNRPKGQVAWKFQAEEAQTILKAIVPQVGHTGAITPVGIVEPVRIGGTTVTKASLANWENVRTLGAFIGATVKIVKAGDIIPMITSVISTFDASLGHQKIDEPTVCPVCGTPLERRKNVSGTDSVVLFCPNPDCEAKTVGKIKRFTKSRDIQGLGDSVIAALTDAGIVTKVPHLYTLKAEKIENLIINVEKGVRLGRKRAEAICSEIAEKGTKMSLPEFLGAFGTRSLGVRRATLMIEANPLLETLESWFDGSLKDEDFSQAAGVPKAGAVIFEGLKENEDVIRETLPFITIEKTIPKTATAVQGLVICITGSLPSGKKKKEYSAPLAALGHQLVDDLSSSVNALVMADPNGPESSKTKKAKKLGIPLHDESWLQDLLKSPPPNNGGGDGGGNPPSPSAPTTPTVNATITSPSPVNILEVKAKELTEKACQMGFSFSAHQITKALRRLRDEKPQEMAGTPTAAGILHTDVKPIVQQTVGQEPSYTSGHKTEGSATFLLYQPLAGGKSFDENALLQINGSSPVKVAATSNPPAAIPVPVPLKKVPAPQRTPTPILATAPAVKTSATAAPVSTSAPTPAATPTPAAKPACVQEVKLIFTDLSFNNNKHWTGRLLPNGDVVTEWGRVGKASQTKTYHGAGAQKLDAKVSEKLAKGYTHAKVVSGQTSQSSGGDLNKAAVKQAALNQIKLSDPTLQKLVNTLVERNIHQITTNTQLTFDSASGLFQTPLGIVVPSAIDEAYRLLQDLQEFAERKDYNSPRGMRLAGDYLRLIPQDFGMRLSFETIFPDRKAIQKQKDLLESLEASYKALQNRPASDQKAGDVKEEKLFDLELHKATPQEKERVRKFYEKTASSMHRGVQGKRVQEVYIVHTPTQKARFEKEGKPKGTVWELWHGTKLANVLNILRVGLKMAPPKTAAIAGSMFGPGLYFSSVSSKSLNYATNYWHGGRGSNDNTLYMFLAQVAMGKYEVPSGPRNRKPSPGYNSYYAKPGESQILNPEMIVFSESDYLLTHLVEFS